MVQDALLEADLGWSMFDDGSQLCGQNTVSFNFPIFQVPSSHDHDASLAATDRIRFIRGRFNLAVQRFERSAEEARRDIEEDEVK
jgi:hypothetical protein